MDDEEVYVTIVDEARRYTLRSQHYHLTCEGHKAKILVSSEPSIVQGWTATMWYRFPHIKTVGFAVEKDPTYPNEASTLQLCVAGNILIFQLRHAADFPSTLRAYLTEPDITFASFSAAAEGDLLARSPHGVRVRKLVNLADVAHRDCIYWMDCDPTSSMEQVVQSVLRIYMMDDVLERCSDWGDYWLEDSQVKYAGVRALLAQLVGDKIEAWNWPRE